MPKWKCTIGYSVGLSLNVCACVQLFIYWCYFLLLSFPPSPFLLSVVVLLLLFCLIYRMCPRFIFEGLTSCGCSLKDFCSKERAKGKSPCFFFSSLSLFISFPFFLYARVRSRAPLHFLSNIATFPPFFLILLLLFLSSSSFDVSCLRCLLLESAIKCVCFYYYILYCCYYY